MFYCFGCHKGGDVITFIMEAEHLPYVDAVVFLANMVGLPVPQKNVFDTEIAELRKRILEINRAAARFYFDTLFKPEGKAGLEYFKNRKLTPTTVRRFGLGYAPDSWDSLLKHLLDKGYALDDIKAAGLAIQSKTGGKHFDRFRSRCMFPIIDHRGNVIGFGGRTMDANNPAKYLNSSENLVFKKGQNLFALNIAKNTKETCLILCEGYMDVISLHQAGFDNAVACMGTALTQEQIHLLSRFTKELVLCYDNDKAGQMATDRALELLENTEFKVKVLRLPQRLVDGQYVKQDADDFIKYQGRDAFEKLLSGSANGMEFTLSQVADKYDLKEDKDRIAYAAEIAETLARLGDPVEREVYTTRAAEAAGLPAEAMRMEVERARKRSYAKEKKQQERREMNPVSDRQPIERGMRYANMRSAMAEEGVIRLLLQDDSLFPEQMPVLPEDFSSPALAHIYDEMWKRRGRGGVASLAAVLGPEEMDHLTVILQKPESAANAPQALADYIRIIQEEYNKRAGDLDPLAAACKTYKDKKGYGGKRT